jgi:small subunit ribosomal protein S20
LPTHKSAAKRVKTAERDRQRNKNVKSILRATVKEFKSSKGGEKKASEFKELVSLLDKAAHRRVIHKNKAARTKSRLARLLKTK